VTWAAWFSTQAEIDLAELLDQSAEFGFDAAARLNSRLGQKIDQLRNNPLSGPERNDIKPGLRYAVVDPFLLFYRFEMEEIEIVRIIHGALNLGRVFDI
jgi:toxin ParE1/3/4